MKHAQFGPFAFSKRQGRVLLGGGCALLLLGLRITQRFAWLDAEDQADFHDTALVSRAVQLVERRKAWANDPANQTDVAFPNVAPEHPSEGVQAPTGLRPSIAPEQ